LAKSGLQVVDMRKQKYDILAKDFFKNLLALLLGLGIGLILVMIFFEKELRSNKFFSPSAHSNVTIEGNYAHNFHVPDPDLGYKNKPSVQANFKKKIGNKLIYKTVYNTDEYSRRITPVKNIEKRNKFIIFFGGSYTFGEGLNNNQTLPYYFGQLNPTFMPYNYGCGGWGTQQMLVKLQSNSIMNEIKEKEGLAVYVFIDYHITRVIGAAHTLSWTSSFPRYEIDANGNLIRSGTLSSLKASSSTSDFKINFYKNIKAKHIKLTAKIIEEAKNTFQKKFENKDFYVLFYPGSRLSNKLIPYLNKAGVKYFYFPNLKKEIHGNKYIILGDKHPNQNAHELVAKKLTEKLTAHQK
jgi:hypothetical protein